MSEKIRIRKQGRKQKRVYKEGQDVQLENDRSNKVKDRLDRLDAAIDDIIGTSSGPTVQSIIPGAQEQHDIRPLSDEELWIRFHQKPGE